MQKPKIYTVGTAHLDTTWCWNFETTLREYIPKTLKDNFALFEKYPDYKFSFEGSYRYELMEEYYPELFEKLKDYVAQGRWNVFGTSYENGDVNVPSPEALFRNILYGNGYFRKTFGKESKDIYLPDCFGFGWALPSIAHHANLMGFSTQKLPWSSAFGIPFDLGKWQGVDGNSIYASLDARSYCSVLSEVRKNKGVLEKLPKNITDYDLPYTFIYHGVGDRGGAPKEESVATVCREIKENASSEWDVLSAPADQIFKDMDAELTDEQKSKLPVWKTELVSQNHGVGSYTSRTAGKRFNRRAEQLADAAERSASAAVWMNGYTYPQEKLDKAWKRVISHQFHDDITGTSLMECYKRNWNDYVLSLNEFSEEYRSAVGEVASRLDTSFVKDKAVVVNNPVQGERNDTVVAELRFDNNPVFIAVYDDKGKEVPSQILYKKGNMYRIAFVADVPSVGYRVYDVRESTKACSIFTGLRINERRLENDKFVVALNENGDVCSIFDKKLNKQLLEEPIEMRIFNYNGSGVYPAWELCYDEVMAKHTAVPKLQSIRIKEDGPARIAVETVKRYGDSIFRQVVSLSANGEYVDFFNEIDWRSLRKLLKTNFTFTAENPKAKYDLGLGYISRNNNTKKLYEVPAQMWADITDIGGTYGVSVFSDSRYGWDKPESNTLRLTGMHTPRSAYLKDSSQNTLDLGLNRYGFAVYSHEGEGVLGTQLNAAYFNQPMNTFVTDVHNGVYGTSYSFANIKGNAAIRCIKKAQNSDEVIVRVNELEGKAQTGVELTLADGIRLAKSVFASEDVIENVKVTGGKIKFDLKPFEVKTFALTLKKAKKAAAPVAQEEVELEYNTCVTLENDNFIPGGLPNKEALPREMFPETVECGGVVFKFGAADKKNALIPSGNTVSLPAGSKKLHIVAASFAGDKPYTVKIGDKDYTFIVSDAVEAVGAWDMYALGETGYIKNDVLAWNVTHTHSTQGDEYGKNLYFFKYTFELPENADSVYFTSDSDIVILAASVTKNVGFCNTASKHFDTLAKRKCTYKYPFYEKVIGDAIPLWSAVDFMKYGDPGSRSANFDSEIEF